MRTLVLAALLAALATGCVTARAVPLRPVRIIDVSAADAWAAAASELVARGYNVQVSDRDSGILSSDWTPWSCAGPSQTCRKHMAINFMNGGALVRGAFQVCQPVAAGRRSAARESCREGDSTGPFADAISAEQDAIASAIAARGKHTAPRIVSTAN